jgi:hypothetical protein
MKTHRRTAIIVGILYIIGTAAGVASVVVTGPVLDAPDYLDKVAANANPMIIGALFILTMGLALAMVPVFMFPILKKHNETLALGYVVFRGALETFTYFVPVISWLLLITLSREFVTAAAPDASYFQTLGTLLAETSDWAGEITTIVFGLGALILYYLFYQTKLIPRWISIWGLIAIVLHLAAGLLAMVGVITTFSTIQVVMNIPIALQEMVMAVWLIVKGFNPSAIASGSAQESRS